VKKTRKYTMDMYHIWFRIFYSLLIMYQIMGVALASKDLNHFMPEND